VLYGRPSIILHINLMNSAVASPRGFNNFDLPRQVGDALCATRGYPSSAAQSPIEPRRIEPRVATRADCIALRGLLGLCVGVALTQELGCAQFSAPLHPLASAPLCSTKLMPPPGTAGISTTGGRRSGPEIEMPDPLIRSPDGFRPPSKNGATEPLRRFAAAFSPQIRKSIVPIQPPA